MELQTRGERPSRASEYMQRDSNYFIRHRKRLVPTAESDFAIPRSSIHRILRNRIHLYPCRLRTIQELKERDYEALVSFATFCREKVQSEDSFLNRITFSDECIFYVEGKANRHNGQIWSLETPHETRELSKESEKLQFRVPF